MLLGMLDIEVLAILMNTCEVIDSQKLAGSLTFKLCGQQTSQNAKQTHLEDHRTDSGNANQSSVNILDYFQSSVSIEAHKEANRLV